MDFDRIDGGLNENKREAYENMRKEEYIVRFEANVTLGKLL